MFWKIVSGSSSWQWQSTKKFCEESLKRQKVAVGSSNKQIMFLLPTATATATCYKLAINTSRDYLPATPATSVR